MNGDPVLTSAGNPFLVNGNPAIEGKALSGITCDLSLVSGAAFISNPSIDLALLAGKGYKITLSDGTNSLVGWIKSAGPGETLSPEILGNPSFTTDVTLWAALGGATIAWDATPALLLTINGVGGGFQTSGTYDGTGKLIRQELVWIAGTYSGEMWVFQNSVAAGYVNASADGSLIENYTGTTATIYAGAQRKTAATGTTLYTLFSIKQILTPSSDGVVIKQGAADDTETWTSDGGINPNAASFTLTITKS